MSALRLKRLLCLVEIGNVTIVVLERLRWALASVTPAYHDELLSEDAAVYHDRSLERNRLRFQIISVKVRWCSNSSEYLIVTIARRVGRIGLTQLESDLT